MITNHSQKYSAIIWISVHSFNTSILSTVVKLDVSYGDHVHAIIGVWYGELIFIALGNTPVITEYFKSVGRQQFPAPINSCTERRLAGHGYTGSNMSRNVQWINSQHSIHTYNIDTNLSGFVQTIKRRKTNSRVFRTQNRGHSEIDYNSPIMQFRTLYTTELECILNGMPWRRSALSECF